jgi:hypothetical protein
MLRLHLVGERRQHLVGLVDELGGLSGSAWIFLREAYQVLFALNPEALLKLTSQFLLDDAELA